VLTTEWKVSAGVVVDRIQPDSLISVD